MERAKGILYAALSSSTFGLAPLFTLLLLAGGYSPFEALSYRWGVAALFLGVLAVFSGRSFRLGRRELVTVFLLSLFRAATSLSLIIAYQHIASGVASTIHFMYPLAVALAMMCFFREKGSAWVFAAIGMSVVGAVLLSLGNVDFTVENSALGMVSACVSVFSYGGYIVGVRKSRAVEIDSAVLTCYVMGLGALYFILGGLLTGGVRIETDGMTWLCILGLALPATALSNMTLVQAIKPGTGPDQLPEMYMMQQATQMIPNMEPGYHMDAVLRVKNCLYAHYTGPLSQSQLASSKLQIHAFENDIKMTGSSYTIYVNQDDDDAVVDVFMETK